MHRNAGDRSDRRANGALAVWLAVTVVAAVFPYLASLGGEFVLDDHELIVENPLIHKLSNLPQVFSRHYLTGWANTESLYYRPLVTASFQLNYAISGPDPFAFRLTNVLLHAVAAVLVLLIALQLTESVVAAGVAGIVFGIMACHAESVAWISGRTDVLAAVFALGSVLAFQAGCRRTDGFSWPLGIACSALAMCAMLSKESTIVLPALIVVYIWAVGERPTRWETAKWTALLIAPFIVYLALRVHVLDTTASGVGLGFLLRERLLRMGFVYATYLRMMLLPQDARFFYGHVSRGMTVSPLLVILAAVPVCMAALAVRLRQRAPAAAFGLTWVLVSLIPASDFVHTNTLLPAERFTYLPSVGMAVLLGWLTWQTRDRLPKGRPLLRACIAIACATWVSASVFFTVVNSQYYGSDLNWARRVSETDPHHMPFRLLAAKIYEEAGEGRSALREYEAALDIERDRSSEKWQAAIRHKLGTTYAEIGDMAGAARAFSQAVVLDPERAEAWRDLGRASLRLGRFRPAIRAFERQFSLGIPSTRDRLELGQAYKGADDTQNARRQFELVISTSPGSNYARTAEVELESMRRR